MARLRTIVRNLGHDIHDGEFKKKLKPGEKVRILVLLTRTKTGLTKKVTYLLTPAPKES